MGKLSKFEDVDVFASLSAILKQNTGFYQSDFDIDKSIITQAAASPHKEDKTLLWLCRPMGTHCFRERDVFLKDVEKLKVISMSLTIQDIMSVSRTRSLPPIRCV